jgi:hypothetical protein
MPTSTPATADHETRGLYRELTRALSELRPGERAGDLAAHLVRRDFGAELVALTGYGERAVYFRPLAQTLTAVPFHANGFDDDRARTEWDYVDDPAAWVDAYRDDLDWVHPRYRWVLDADPGDAVRERRRDRPE